MDKNSGNNVLHSECIQPMNINIKDNDPISNIKAINVGECFKNSLEFEIQIIKSRGHFFFTLKKCFRQLLKNTGRWE